MFRAPRLAFTAAILVLASGCSPAYRACADWVDETKACAEAAGMTNSTNTVQTCSGVSGDFMEGLYRCQTAGINSAQQDGRCTRDDFAGVISGALDACAGGGGDDDDATGDDDSTAGDDDTTTDQICSDTCEYAGDGACDDGGPDSEFDECDYGTDCTDCGSRPVQ